MDFPPSRQPCTLVRDSGFCVVVVGDTSLQEQKTATEDWQACEESTRKNNNVILVSYTEKKFRIEDTRRKRDLWSKIFRLPSTAYLAGILK